MATHRLFVEMDLREVEVTTKDVVFFVYRKRKKFGELRLSRGAIVWRGRSDQIGRKMSWTRFDRHMQQEASRQELRPPGARRSVSKKRRKS